MTTKYKLQYGISIFQGKKKIKEIRFKSEEQMMTWIYKHKQYDH